MFLQIGSADLCDHLAVRVSDFKKLRGGVIFRNELPRNSVGKLVRREMREWARKQMEAESKKRRK